MMERLKVLPHAKIDDCWNKIGVRGNGSCPELEQHIHCRNCPVYSAAAKAFLDRDLPEDHLEEWSSHFARQKHGDDRATDCLLIFRIGFEWLALPPTLFQEVVDLRPIHSLPHRRSGSVLGLVNVRGELLVCVSLGHMLGVEKTEEWASARVSPGKANAHCSSSLATPARSMPAIAAGWKRVFWGFTPQLFQCGLASTSGPVGHGGDAVHWLTVFFCKLAS